MLFVISKVFIFNDKLFEAVLLLKKRNFIDDI